MTENRLAQETSPYLLQHQDNPVHWQPWGSDAFAAARAADKPILLSVGYAACHWCHVMAHESFEVPEIAAVMNALFVNIKVDREERPDVDTIYQSALALLGEQGGWPLTMFLTPEGEPFWGGTYFPPSARYGRPGFVQVLRGIATAHAEKKSEVAQNVAALKQSLAKLSQNHQGEMIPLSVNDQVAERLAQEFDPINGGLGGAPKFPQPAVLKLLWRAWKRSGSEPCRQAVELTLTRMCQGGIYDHLAGGFARYTVDERWLVPHFEKMLYDNAQLIDLLLWAWQETGNPLYETRLRETIAWALTDMVADRSGTGAGPAAFASSYDADSEGEEGKFYVWNEAEVDALLGEAAAAFKAAYEVTAGGNWEGKTILNRLHAPELGAEAEEAALAESRKILLAARAKRVPPGWDDKVLADWNGLMIAALARSAAALADEGLLTAAAGYFRFIQECMTREGRLKHAFRHGRLQHPATLDDYANLCDAALALHSATAEARYLTQAQAWADELEQRYWDSDGGGYFLTADDTEQLIVRTKSVHDNATPSGNGIMVGVLARLYYLTGEETYRARAEAVIRAFSGELQRNFFPLSSLLNGSELLQSALQVVIVGAPADRAGLLAVFHGLCLPNAILQCVEAGRDLPNGHPAAGKEAKDGRPTAYVCRGPTCSLPICESAELKTALQARPL